MTTEPAHQSETSAEGASKTPPAAEKTASKAESKSDEKRIPISRLISESQGFLGVKKHVAAGALNGVTKQALTVEEAQARIAKWRRKPVKEA